MLIEHQGMQTEQHNNHSKNKKHLMVVIHIYICTHTEIHAQRMEESAEYLTSLGSKHVEKHTWNMDPSGSHGAGDAGSWCTVHVSTSRHWIDETKTSPRKPMETM
jgi:hypothetical protein